MNQNEDYATQVAAGVALLDAKAPAWRDRVKWWRLDLGDCGACILGQVYDGYIAGLRSVFGSARRPASGGTWAKAVAHGFATDGSYEMLTHFWLLELRRDE